MGSGTDDAGLEHWPKPEFADMDGGWFADVGLPLVREILCDRIHGQRTIESSRKGAGQERELTREETAQPFLIRAVRAGFDPQSTIVKDLGELLFACGNRFAPDGQRLARHGLAARTLVATSSGAWSWTWSGGTLSEAELAGPGPAAPEKLTALSREPLAVLVEGTFPSLEAAAAPAGEFSVHAPARPGRLLAIGSAAMFRNELFTDPNYDNAGFALNAVADLALGEALGAVMARRQMPPSFTPPDGATRLTLRAVTVASVPGVLFVLGLAALARRARSRPGNRPRPAGGPQA